jgi:hypothetical protein
MAKMETILHVNTNYIEKEVKKIIKKHEDKLIEKIAFSLFTIFYYKHNFCFEQDKYLNKMKLEEIKQLWILGKMKNKVKNFISLGKQIFDMKFDDNKENKENINDNNA